MSDTPETDAACETVYAQGVAHIPLVGFMEKLERERNEARKDAEKTKSYKRVLKTENARLRRLLEISKIHPALSEPFQNRDSDH